MKSQILRWAFLVLVLAFVRSTEADARQMYCDEVCTQGVSCAASCVWGGTTITCADYDWNGCDHGCQPQWTSWTYDGILGFRAIGLAHNDHEDCVMVYNDTQYREDTQCGSMRQRRCLWAIDWQTLRHYAGPATCEEEWAPDPWGTLSCPY